MTVHHYTIQEAAEILQVKERAVQRRCKRAGLKKQGNKYLIPKHILDQWTEGKPYTANEQPYTQTNMYGLGLHKQEDGTVMQVFTQEEYETFKRMLIEHKQLKERVSQLEEWKQTFLHYAQGRNVLSAHDKGLITPPKQEESEDIEQEAIVKHLHEKRKEVLRKGTLSTWMTQFKGEA